MSLLLDIKDFDSTWVSDKLPEELYPVGEHELNAHYQMGYITVKACMSIQKALFTDEDGAAARQEFKELTTLELPTPPPIANLKFPKLGPFKDETSVEPYNRMLNILLYVQFSINKSTWPNRFGNTNWAMSRKLRANDLPDWMREHTGSQDSVDGLADEPLDAAQGPEAKPTNIEIVWAYQNDDEDQKAYLDFAKKKYKSMFLMGKPKRHRFSVSLDPRMTVEMFRDAIRIALDIQSTESQLIEVWQELDEIQLLSDADWDLLKPSLLDGRSKGLFSIMLRQREQHEGIFEYDGPPLLLIRHLQKQEDDVSTVQKV